jgi:hypothetical protein
VFYDACVRTLTHAVMVQHDSNLTYQDVSSYVKDITTDFNSQVRGGKRSGVRETEAWLANEELQQAWKDRQVPQGWIELQQHVTAAEGNRAKAVLMAKAGALKGRCAWVAGPLNACASNAHMCDYS